MWSFAGATSPTFHWTNRLIFDSFLWIPLNSLQNQRFLKISEIFWKIRHFCEISQINPKKPKKVPYLTQRWQPYQLFMSNCNQKFYNSEQIFFFSRNFSQKVIFFTCRFFFLKLYYFTFTVWLNRFYDLTEILYN